MKKINLSSKVVSLIVIVSLIGLAFTHLFADWIVYCEDIPLPYCYGIGGCQGDDVWYVGCMLFCEGAWGGSGIEVIDCTGGPHK